MESAAGHGGPLLKRKRRNKSNPLTTFDISVGGQPAGKVVFELYKDVVPKVYILLNFMISVSYQSLS